jgi:hypothetical protein
VVGFRDKALAISVKLLLLNFLRLKSDKILNALSTAGTLYFRFPPENFIM